MVTVWLTLVVIMIFVMIVLGGVTRLTQSGLSMVEWQPITGWLPPQDAAAWEDAFEKYRQFPEYQHLNVGMTVEEFKRIFLMEFGHRVWGQTTGLLILLPLVGLVLFRRLDGWLSRRMFVAFLLYVSQGVLGWYMVTSGLIDEPDVSPYRLTAHLGLGVAVFGLVVWTLLQHRASVPAGHKAGHEAGHETEHEVGPRRGARVWAVFVAALIFLTILSGGFVAGLNAGLTYNTFPLMDGRLVPEGLNDLSPAYRNIFENITTVQFDHRVLAMTTFASVVLIWMVTRLRGLSPKARRAASFLLAVVLVQVGLGISTLLMVVPVTLASMHQAGAMVLFACALWTVHALRPDRPRPQAEPDNEAATGGQPA